MSVLPLKENLPVTKADGISYNLTSFLPLEQTLPDRGRSRSNLFEERILVRLETSTLLVSLSVHPPAKSGEGRMAQRSNDSEYQIVLYRVLSADPATVGLESSAPQAAGRISRLRKDLLIPGTLYLAL